MSNTSFHSRNAERVGEGLNGCLEAGWDGIKERCGLMRWHRLIIQYSFKKSFVYLMIYSKLPSWYLSTRYVSLQNCFLILVAAHSLTKYLAASTQNKVALRFFAIQAIFSKG